MAYRALPEPYRPARLVAPNENALAARLPGLAHQIQRYRGPDPRSVIA